MGTKTALYVFFYFYVYTLFPLLNLLKIKSCLLKQYILSKKEALKLAKFIAHCT